MAALVASVPLPLLLDSLLASSWTWLALSLATIATLLRAFSRIPLSRHRPQALLPPPPSILSAETEQISSLVCEVPHPLWNIQKRRIESTSVLENLLEKPDELACRELEVLSCVHDCHAAPALLREATSASKLLNGQPSGVIGDFSEDAPRLWPHRFHCKLGLMPRLGFLVDTLKGGFEAPTRGFIKEDVNPHHSGTSDVFSRGKPLQNSVSYVPHSSLDTSLCFETQFGWHKLLEMRLGAPWRNHWGRSAWASMQVLEPKVHAESVVKLWSSQQRNLLEALMVKVSSVAALDVNIRAGLACTAYQNGEISRWDITNQACLSRVCSNAKSISALCLNAEKGVAITGNGEFLGLWDYKSPGFIPILDGSERPSPCAALQCKGDMLLIHRTNGAFSSCDLRKPQGSCLSVDTHADSLPVPSKTEEEESLVLWEKLACDEEEFWDEYSFGNGSALQKSSSFTSRCATLVRSLSTSGR